jgi:hypothetical protein
VPVSRPAKAACACGYKGSLKAVQGHAANCQTYRTEFTKGTVKSLEQYAIDLAEAAPQTAADKKTEKFAGLAVKKDNATELETARWFGARPAPSQRVDNPAVRVIVPPQSPFRAPESVQAFYLESRLL